jgi:transcriptional regulator with XRE-family HTH domain
MKELTSEQIEYAVGRFVALVEFRDLSQTQLEQLSGVPQPTISKVMNRSQWDAAGGTRIFAPSVDVLKSLFKALGLKLADVLNESEAVPQEISGYLATPLTGVVQDGKAEAELVDVVARVRRAAAAPEFVKPQFDIYWPGDYTHPVRNANFSPSQVYRTDRSRASTFDFIILFCAEPSYGVGQENEIATQAGVPAVRILAPGVSRMMSGAFIEAIDLHYSGTLHTHIRFSLEELSEALRKVRFTYFRHRALYKGMNGDRFGPRLKKLVDERVGDYKQFAHDLGVDLSYLHALMEEPFAVSNPSVRLLKRMAALLQEHVAYLIGESEETDPVWVESNSTWHSWITNAEDVDGRIAVLMRDNWRASYFQEKRLAETRDCRSTPMTVSGWDRRYREEFKKEGSHAGQTPMFT